MSAPIPIPPGGVPLLGVPASITAKTATEALAHKFTRAASETQVTRADVLRASAMMIVQALIQLPEGERRRTWDAIAAAIRRDVFGETVAAGGPLDGLILPPGLRR